MNENYGYRKSGTHAKVFSHMRIARMKDKEIEEDKQKRVKMQFNY